MIAQIKSIFQNSSLKEMILWWEKNRIIYNILIISLSIFSMYSYWDYPMRRITGGNQIILDAIVFIFGANLFYTVSWLSGLTWYYFNDQTTISSKRKRWFLFVLGTLFALIWTNFYFVVTFDILFAY